MSDTHNAVSPVAIVGAGSIGVAFALVFARVGHPVVLTDPDAARRESVLPEVSVRLAALDRHGLLESDTSTILDRISTTGSLSEALEGAVLVQECAPEQLEIKRSIFAELDALAAPQAVLASSSSALAAGAFACGLPGSARCLVAHPANPPYLIPVIELVPAPFTSTETLETARELYAAAKLSPVLVHGEPEGFVFNRLQGAVLREAYALVRDGVAGVEDIDTVVREGLGRRWCFMGPFETVDLNTRGGIESHAAKMGPAYARMGAERGQDDPWYPELVAAVAAQRRAVLPLEQWEDRVAWRDEELMKRLKHTAKGKQ